MTVRWSPLEVDLLSGVADLATRPGPRYVVGPAGREDEPALVELLLVEARRYHELEREVAAREASELERTLEKRAEGVEHDRTGRAGPRSLPGHEQARDRLERARRRLARHEDALARSGGPEATDDVRALLRRHFDIRPRAELEALKARAGEGELVELFADGYALEPSLARRLVARRHFLGLPSDRDWAEDPR